MLDIVKINLQVIGVPKTIMIVNKYFFREMKAQVAKRVSLNNVSKRRHLKAAKYDSISLKHNSCQDQTICLEGI